MVDVLLHLVPEQNRVITDRLSSYLMCPTEVAVENLKKEGITDGVFVSGDLMMDSLKETVKVVQESNSTVPLPF